MIWQGRRGSDRTTSDSLLCLLISWRDIVSFESRNILKQWRYNSYLMGMKHVLLFSGAVTSEGENSDNMWLWTLGLLRSPISFPLLVWHVGRSKYFSMEIYSPNGLTEESRLGEHFVHERSGRSQMLPFQSKFAKFFVDFWSSWQYSLLEGSTLAQLKCSNMFDKSLRTASVNLSLAEMLKWAEKLIVSVMGWLKTENALGLQMSARRQGTS